uniref:Uncharacterized protein n=1 Tax=Myotis myotis TaxID=51298 RepID=A0A7J7UD81_MYOMY|nr:hypothetical protein mMyoMyo1_008772 [Myotis myotis]
MRKGEGVGAAGDALPAAPLHFRPRQVSPRPGIAGLAGTAVTAPGQLREPSERAGPREGCQRGGGPEVIEKACAGLVLPFSRHCCLRRPRSPGGLSAALTGPQHPAAGPPQRRRLRRWSERTGD